MSNEQDLSYSNAVTATQAIDDTRVEERSRRHYFRIFGESYKGHYRGALTGMAIGGLFAAVAGTAICALIPGLWALAPLAIPAFAGIGAMMGAEAFSVVGSASASRAASLAEKHVRLSDPSHSGNDLAAFDDRLMSDGRGYHYEFPRERDKGKFFNLKSGAVGAIITGGLGGLLGMAGALANFAPAVALAAHLPFTVATFAFLGPVLAPVAPIAIAAALASGLIGLTFGVERSVFKSIFNQTDANIRGRIHDGRQGPDIGHAQFKDKENNTEILQHRLRRQEEMSDLGKKYNKKIFWGALGGRFRGFAGGVTTGVLMGAAVGALAFGIVCLPALLGMAGVASLAAIALPSLGLLGTLTGAFAAAGGLLGMSIFSEAGTEAGAESTARGIDEEFERNRLLKSKGVTLPIPEKPKAHWFNGKAVLIAGLIGAAIGAVLCPVMGTLGIVALLHLSTGAALGASVITGGLFGMGYGIGSDVWKSFGKAADWIYDKGYFRPEPDMIKAPEPTPVQTPVHERITAEDNAKLNERMNASPRKNFTETLSQQMQPSPAPLTTGM